MNAFTHRDMIAQVVIILAACVGGWMIFIEPRNRELNTLEATIAQARASPAATDPAFAHKLAEAAQALRGRVEVIEARNAVATDSSGAYQRIRALAGEHRVQLLSLNPGALGQSDARRSDPLRPAAARMDITVEGAYENVARFIEAVSAIDGFMRPAHLTLTAVQRDGEELVEAQLACDALSFMLPEAVAGLLGEVTHAQP
jgi:hypothetical protein